MDIGALASALIGAQMGRIQMAVAAKLLQTNTGTADAAARLIDAADRSMERLAIASAGIGQNVDISV
jgi:hypothetical protein